MPSVNETSPGDGTGPSAEEKPRLTEEEKKQNHIASEQKRRQAIREGFDRLTELVPGLEGQGRSEGLVLKRTVEFIRQQLDERRSLIECIENAGGQVDDKLKNLSAKRTTRILQRVEPSSGISLAPRLKAASTCDNR